MRLKFYLLAFLLGCCFNVLALNITIHSQTEDNHTSYMLHAGAFSNENNARALQEQLTKKTPVPVHITYSKDKNERFFFC